MRHNRLDTVRLDQVQKTGSGGVRLPAVLTRSGVFVYHDQAGKEIREYRPPEEVLRADSVASLEDVPVTIGHPRAGVTPETYQKESVGHVRASSLRTDEATKGVAAVVVVARKDAIERIERRELSDISAGYSVEIDPTPGVTPEGEPYDRVQRSITYNHVALLRRGDGRQGSSVGLRLDGAHNQLDEDSSTEQPAMKIKVRCDGKEHEVEAGSAEHIALQTRADAERDAAVASANAERDSLKAERDAVKARLDAIDAAAAKAKRTALEAVAAKVIGKEFKADGKTDRQIMAEVVTKTDGRFSDDGTPERAPYVEARFDYAIERIAPNNLREAPPVRHPLETVPEDVRTDGEDPLARIARARTHADKLIETKPSFSL